MTYEHDHPGDDAHEYTTTDGDVEVRVSKVGGGTVGREYEGTWHYTVVSGGVTARGSDLHTGMPHTHEEAARLLVELTIDDAWFWQVEVPLIGETP